MIAGNKLNDKPNDVCGVPGEIVVELPGDGGRAKHDRREIGRAHV